MQPLDFQIWTSNLGIKDKTPDFALIASKTPAVCSGVYTQSRFVGPSVEIARAVTAAETCRAIATISKNANVANGDVGMQDALGFQALVAQHLNVDVSDVAICSTGVIGRPYPMDVITSSMKALSAEPNGDFQDAAHAIMTTDTTSKMVTKTVGDASIVGIAKGVGMIEPNMATLLCYFCTDANIAKSELDATFARVMATTFNALSIDSDTSTSDSAIIMANGAAGTVDMAEFEVALHELALELTKKVALDGEGASKMITCTVAGASSDSQAKTVAKAIINSPLVKTAVHGADPNWGRIAMAIGKTEDETICQELVEISIGDVLLYPVATSTNTADLAAARTRDPVVPLAAAEAHMAGTDVQIGVSLGLGSGSFTAYGCDLSDQYIRINADYTT